jgi:hypothetical membrane protein|nr:MAG: hypothetical protein TU35_08125 [Thermoproteus sp. AZ2]
MRIYPLVLAIGSLQFIIIVFIAQALYPGYSVWANYISDLGNSAKAGPFIAAIFNSSAAALGLMVLASSYGVGALTRRRALSTALLALAGAGALGVGLFPEGSPYGLHTLSSLIAFLFGGLAVIALGLLTEGPAWLRWLGVVMGALTLVSLALYIALGEPPIVERPVAYPVLVYAVIYGLYEGFGDGRKRPIF